MGKSARAGSILMHHHLSFIPVAEERLGSTTQQDGDRPLLEEGTGSAGLRMADAARRRTRRRQGGRQNSRTDRPYRHAFARTVARRGVRFFPANSRRVKNVLSSGFRPAPFFFRAMALRHPPSGGRLFSPELWLLPLSLVNVLFLWYRRKSKEGAHSAVAWRGGKKGGRRRRKMLRTHNASRAGNILP